MSRDGPAPKGIALPGWADQDTSLSALMEGLEARRAPLRARSPLEMADLLGSVGERFTVSGTLRQSAIEALLEDPGYSEPMAVAVLDGVAREWSRERLRKLVIKEFGSAAVRVGNLVERDWSARSPAIHVCAGNVPGVSVTSLIRGLLVGSASIVKPGRSDRALPVLFHRSLEQVAPDIAAACAIRYWTRDQLDVAAALSSAALLVVHGGSDAIGWARRSAGVSTHLVEYPHRISVLLVTSDGQSPQALERGARSAALAVALFEQRGCVSPQAIFVIDDPEVGQPRGTDPSPKAVGPRGAAVWAERLAVELGRLETELPPGRRTPAEASAFHQEAGMADMSVAAGEGTRVWGAGREWRVVLEVGNDLRASCLGRFVRIYAAGSFEEALAQIARLRPQLQTVGIVGSLDREGRARLTEAGALRVTGVENVPWPPAWAKLDGVEPLRSLVRWWEGD